MEQRIDELVKSYREDMIQSLEELVSIPSDQPGERRGGRALWTGDPQRPGRAYEAGRGAWI